MNCLQRNISMQSPKTLQVLCISSLAKNPEILWRRKGGSQLSERNGGVEWRDSEIFLSCEFAERLIDILSCDGILRHGILRTFTQEHACLKNVMIYHSNGIADDELQVFSHHKLISLHIENLHHVNMCTVLKCIGDKSYESLQRLVLQLCQRVYGFWPHDDDLVRQSSIVETLSRFNCLKSVQINDSNLSSATLTILGKSLLHVENLDLSGNKGITDISPLKNCQKTLKSLSLGWLPGIKTKSAMATFVTLTGLTYLDVSSDFWLPFDNFSREKEVFTADKLLELPDVLPNLKCLDLSGRNVSSEQALSQFLDAHPSLQMLVLWRSDACQFKSLQDYRPGLTVGGDATLEQYAAVLMHWTRVEELKGMSFYREKVLNIMFRLSDDRVLQDFPPCQDDQLVQAVLGLLANCPRPGHLCDGTDGRVARQRIRCLQSISLLLEKKIVRHLQPDTRQHLLLVCHWVLRLPRPSCGCMLQEHKLAKSILQKLDPPQNHNE